MERKNIGDQIAEEVLGGSIVFNEDHTTCGLNCNNQCKVNDFDAVISFINANYKTMSEADMMRNMAAKGLITRL